MRCKSNGQQDHGDRATASQHAAPIPFWITLHTHTRAAVNGWGRTAVATTIPPATPLTIRNPRPGDQCLREMREEKSPRQSSFAHVGEIARPGPDNKCGDWGTLS